MNKFIRVLLLFFFVSFEANGNEINYFPEGIDYWRDKGKKN